ncbi:MAG: ribbon-helix-helix protein, CopG family [Candidatus Hadarchaeota archaeon]
MTVKNLARVTIALDEGSFQIFDKLRKEEGVSQSALMRRALKFYDENKGLLKTRDKKVDLYVDMLSSGEHIILDMDHWILLLNLIDSSPKKEKFWKGCRAVALAHAEQLRSKVRTPEELLERLEACNFFRLVKNSEKDFTLVLNSNATKKFVKEIVKDFMDCMKFSAEVKEDFSKLRVRLL